MANLAYVNGRFLPIEEAVVQVEDRGLQFGDSVYEVIHVYDKYPWCLEEHLDRLWNSMRFIELEPNFTRADLHSIILEIIQRSGLSNATLYIQVTRGTAPRRHAVPDNVVPTLIVTCREFSPAFSQDDKDHGIAVITHPDIRWDWRQIKATTLLPAVLVRTKAVRQGAYEAVFYEADGTVTEGTSSNVFAVINNEVRTAPADGRILDGVTRRSVLKLCAENGIPAKERAFKVDELFAAQEAFITDTSSEMLPIVKVDGVSIGDGVPGPVTKLLQAAFKKWIERCVAQYHGKSGP